MRSIVLSNRAKIWQILWFDLGTFLQLIPDKPELTTFNEKPSGSKYVPHRPLKPYKYCKDHFSRFEEKVKITFSTQLPLQFWIIIIFRKDHLTPKKATPLFSTIIKVPRAAFRKG